ncbi:amylo-alpha-1,6-glucosidase [bacterium]|nr:amylo-alpha-1,6-glucosidase [bacterium]
MAQAEDPKQARPPEAPPESTTIEVGGEIYTIDRELSAVLASGIPAVLTSCRHGREVIKQENLFLVSDIDGNVYPGCGCGMGLYAADTRFLSGWIFQLEDKVPSLLSSSSERTYLSQIEFMNQVLKYPDGRMIPQETVYISSDRAIEDVVRDRVKIVNYNPFSAELTFSLEFRADYADMFEVRGMHRQHHGLFLQPKIEGHTLILAYMGEDKTFRQTRITFDVAASAFQIEPLAPEHASVGGIVRFTLPCPGHGAETVFAYTVETLIAGEGSLAADKREESFERFVERLDVASKRKVSGCTRLITSNAIYNLILSRSERDIAALSTMYPTGPYLAAGIPWYTAPFGRDGILTAFQSLMLRPDLAYGTLRYLAAHQAREDESFRDAEPGKILHELRVGELARLGQIPQTPYYGSVDSTPLFLILLSETYRWTGDLDLVRELWDAVEAALMWIEVYGDLDGDGFVEYERRSPLGLVVQGWKDSVNSVIRPDATLATGPIALAEVQGYVYDAKKRIAQLCYTLDLRILGDRLNREADELKEAFNHAFWSEEDGFYVLALDGDKKQVRTPTSNPCHGLWSGLIPEERIPGMVQFMMGKGMYSGWGIRTLSADSPVYNPMSYHNGTVWPHDNSLIALGLAQHGYKQEVLVLLDSLYQASLHFPYYRLPELFCGFPKEGDLDRPVPYPVACSPQAWAAGTIFLLLQSALGIVPDAAGNALRIVQPQLPTWLEEVRIDGLRIGQSKLDLQFMQYSGITTARVLSKEGRVKVLIEG